MSYSGTYVAAGEVTALEHELRDDTVELAALVAKALLAGAESAEVLNGLRDDIVVELEVDAALASCTMSVSYCGCFVDIDGRGLTLVGLVHVADLALGVDRGLWAGPGAVEVALDGHVGGRGVEGAVESWLEGV